jgi:ABC-type branched-subunit amino acid transport system permease subunit
LHTRYYVIIYRAIADMACQRAQPTALKEMPMLWGMSCLMAIWLASSLIVPVWWLLSAIGSGLRSIRDDAVSANQATPDRPAIAAGAG